MTTIYTYNELKRLFYTYTCGKSKITFDETYEMFDDLNCLYGNSKENFKILCEVYDKNKNNLMEYDEIYQLYKYIIKKETKW